jgi:hypothetical protein
MIWLIGVTAVLMLGWGFTIIRLLFDEWRVRRDYQPTAKTTQLKNRPGTASGWARPIPREYNL